MNFIIISIPLNLQNNLDNLNIIFLGVLRFYIIPYNKHKKGSRCFHHKRNSYYFTANRYKPTRGPHLPSISHALLDEDWDMRQIILRYTKHDMNHAKNTNMFLLSVRPFHYLCYRQNIFFVCSNTS